MPKKQWINKKTAQHFTLVHRPQNDPLIYDEEAPSMVLNPTNVPSSSKPGSKKLDDLASELGVDAAQIRANEGEAASYGVYYDDTEYDYMQHMRDLGEGSGGGDVFFVEADAKGTNRDKGKGKQQSLEAALRELDIEAEEAKKRELFDDDFLPSKNLNHQTYQSMQDVPDVIGGFQPDMDPRLREVLEALEDEAYVDNEDEEDIFQALAKDGREIDDYEFEEAGEDGWETDDTARPASEYKVGTAAEHEAPSLVPVADANEAAEAAEAADTVNWMEDFKAFKKDQKTSGKKLGAAPSQSDLQSSLMTTTTNGGRRKKRKGALTDTSSYSMTSSSLVRTEQLGILDARFDKLEEQYNADMDDASDMGSVSAVSAVSTVDGPMRADFDSVLDEFLGGYSIMGKKHMRKGGWKNGTEQYDEIRRELGPARIRGKTATKKAAAGAR
ncbi:Low temperature viability protein [Xylariales sp. AK1849]|nr:Low temperature viability protein [Xylariales sp. AK1849]